MAKGILQTSNFNLFQTTGLRTLEITKTQFSANFALESCCKGSSTSRNFWQFLTATLFNNMALVMSSQNCYFLSSSLKYFNSFWSFKFLKIFPISWCMCISLENVSSFCIINLCCNYHLCNLAEKSAVRKKHKTFLKIWLRTMLDGGPCYLIKHKFERKNWS